jgi:hypothetical protein
MQSPVKEAVAKQELIAKEAARLPRVEQRGLV